MQKLFIRGLCVMAFFCSVAQADLTISITQGVDKPYPIAVVPFGADLQNSNLPNGMSGVISNDLANSGRFDLLALNKMPAQPHQLTQFNWQAWTAADTGIEYALLGQINQNANGTYQVNFDLLSLLGSRPLIDEKFNNIPASQLRALAHHISDIVYQTITGNRGYFSTRLAYVDVIQPDSENPTYRLVVSDEDGFNPQVLLSQVGNPIATPQWSPDGSQLAYVSYINNRMAIYSISLSNGTRKIIANFPGMNSAPAWSPDGKSMAMALSKGSGANSDIYIMNLSNRKLTRYTNFANNTSPCWSPDGQSLIFNSDRGGSPQIYQLDLASRQVSRLSFDGAQNFAPVYTANGQEIVIMNQAQANGAIRIATLNPSTNKISIISHGQLDKSPSVSPDGSMVIYANYDGAKGILAETSIDGKVQLKLPATEGTVQSPAWSPFLN
ncbi:MAG: tol-Pal system beta propeller repeat protein TolB [Gammaproteobacteria bacterium]|nr:tol-Pal system beta propeller repeat protein TolB [Gammaproteobacteria bacterium]